MRVQIVGTGRMGSALEAALQRSGIALLPMAGRGATGAGADIVLLAVPDAEISAAASHIAPGTLVGHLSGITTVAALDPHEAFAMHPLLTVTGPQTTFTGAYAAVAGSTPRALAVAEDLAGILELHPFQIADEDRAAYHAAASIASNFLVSIEGFAESLAATAGVPREALVPLAAAALRNWAVRGASSALTGPIVRGDEATVQRQRDAIADRAPEQLALFEALVEETRRLAKSDADTTSVAPGNSGPGSGASS